MSDAVTYIEKLEEVSAKLSDVSGELYRAQLELAEAEEAWEEHYDAVAQELKEELVAASSTRDPAEHTITSVARVRNRELYSRMRRAKRAKDAAEVISSNRRSELTGWQALIRAEGADAQAQDQFNQRESRLPMMRGHR